MIPQSLSFCSPSSLYDLKESRVYREEGWTKDYRLRCSTIRKIENPLPPSLAGEEVFIYRIWNFAGVRFFPVISLSSLKRHFYDVCPHPTSCLLFG
ncbi:hypothetical protein CEXT_139671 [Caerostris extrusa]|uniref:Uncharacterized protein n=1 Tax=Caerostris extrusa TaxID=172846 RepID=A0AAV4RD53_CAEEX|nr:hypothetical protein CEXT_139671 [Caerostris extrusa]